MQLKMRTYSSRSLCDAGVRHSRLYHAAALAKLYGRQPKPN